MKYLAYLIIPIFFLTNCKEDKIEDPVPVQPTVKENAFEPKDNSKIVTQKSEGDTSKVNSYYSFVETTDGIYFGASLSNYYAVGKLNSYGVTVWSKNIGYKVNEIKNINNLIGKDLLLSAGGYDSNANNTTDIGHLTLYDNQGNLLNDKSVSETDYEVSIISVIENNLISVDPGTPVVSDGATLDPDIPVIPDVTDSNPNGDEEESISSVAYIGIGRAKDNAGIYYPYWVDFYIDSNNEIIITNKKVLSLNSGYIFKAINIATDSDKKKYCYVSANHYSNSDQSDYCSIFKFNNLKEFVWKKDVTSTSNLSCWTNALVIDTIASKNQIYLVGGQYSLKTPIPSDGGNWSSGFIASLNSDGNIEWKNEYSLSNHTDVFQSVLFYKNDLYICGYQSKYYIGSNAVGNGVVAKISPTDGTLSSKITLGNKLYSSGLNCMITKSNSFIVGGYTESYQSGSSKSWFVVTNPF